MFCITCTICITRRLNFDLLRCVTVKRYVNNIRYSKYKYDLDPEQPLANIIQKYEDKILYSEYVESRKLRLGYKQNAILNAKKLRVDAKKKLEMQCIEPLPVSLKYLFNSNCQLELKNTEVNKQVLNDVVHFPFKTKTEEIIECSNQSDIDNNENLEHTNIADNEINKRLKYLHTNNWMADYDNYNEQQLEAVNDWKLNYGTPDPNAKISNVPCGGCGALLHCTNTSIPGYIPSEIYKNHGKEGGTALQAIICQRCYFLKNYNLALQVQISPNEYPQVLKAIGRKRKALVMLIVDLLDFPCSIWPGAADLLGTGRPIFLIGNKVDLLPQDNKGFLERVKQHLHNAARESGFAAIDIQHVALISATTGFGIEDLITKLHSYWRYQGDVFLIGCTNVGKSSLFNALLQSDYCKSDAIDLIQRATVSPWPGTTLNLLKFPILRLSGHKSYLRYKRLMQTNKQIAEEKKLRKSQLQKTKNPKYATLIGYTGRTFSSNEEIMGTEDLFSMKDSSNSSKDNNFFDEKNKIYSLSKWCYDTPGVVQPEQVLHLLTTEELLLTLPKEIITPKTFCLNPGSSIFIGGLGRLDYLEGDAYARFSVFCSPLLPITICMEDIANEVYEELLGTDFFAVPIGNSERLKLWPGLSTFKEFSITGIQPNYSCADIVLSSSGWIAITGGPQLQLRVKAWVPKNCGIYIRDSLLPSAVALRGKRIRNTPAYRTNRLYIKE